MAIERDGIDTLRKITVRRYFSGRINFCVAIVTASGNTRRKIAFRSNVAY
jgi:hypothetical protein